MDGMLRGRGAMDMKSGVSAMVFAIEAIRSAGFAPASDILVQTVTEEESTGNGALSTLLRGYRADAVFIPESTEQMLFRGHVGVIWFRLRCRGVAGHASMSRAGSNFILSTLGVLQAVEALNRDFNVEAMTSPLCAGMQDPIKFNVGAIRGGDWASSSPSWCDVDCRIGFPPQMAIAEARARIVAAIEHAAAKDPLLASFPPDVVWTGFQAEPYVLEPDTPAEVSLRRAHEMVLGAPLHERFTEGVNDTRAYGLYFGIPGLCYGGDGVGLHGPNEAVNLAVLKQTTAVIAAFIADWCKLRPL